MSGENINTCHSLGLLLSVSPGRALVAASRVGSSQRAHRVPRHRFRCSRGSASSVRGMGLARGGGPLLAVLFIVGAVSADNDCLWYTDKQGNWHLGFDCRFLQFCCGNCTYRYCCQDPLQLIIERQQKYCATTDLSPTTVAGIASAIFLFIVIIGIIVCCFLCSCCYLYQRRQRLRQAFTGAREVIHSYPMQLTYPSKNMTPAPYPTAPAYGAAMNGGIKTRCGQMGLASWP